MGKEPFLRRIIRNFCPLLLGESFEDFSRIVLIFPDFTVENVIVLLVVYTFYLMFIADGFFYWAIDTQFLLLPRKSLGPFLSSIHFICGAALSEIVILRSCCIYMRFKYGKNNIGWFSVVCKITKSKHPILFKVLKLLIFNLWSGALFVYISNHSSKLLMERALPVDYFVNAAWFVVEVILLRIAIVEFPLHIVMAYACYVHLKMKTDQMLGLFNAPNLTMNAVTKYLRLAKSIIQVHPVMKLVSFTNGLTCIPFVSLAIMLTFIEPQTRVQLIVKIAYLIPISVYSARGMLMTAVVANIDSKSRFLYKMIASRFARGQVVGSVSHQQLVLIMEDLASNKNPHLHTRIFRFSFQPNGHFEQRRCHPTICHAS